MARPQLKNGYMRIANEVIDSLIKCRILEPRARVVMWVLRRTWGWKNKKAINKGTRQMEVDMKISKSSIARSIKQLLDAKILIPDGHDWKFNKDWEQWAANVVDSDGEISSVGLPAVPHQGRVPYQGQKCPTSGTPLHNYKDNKDKQHKRRPPVPIQGHEDEVLGIIKTYYAARSWNLPEPCTLETLEAFMWEALNLLKIASYRMTMAQAAIPAVLQTAEDENWSDCTLKAIARYYPEWEGELSNDEKKKICQVREATT